MHINIESLTGNALRHKMDSSLRNQFVWDYPSEWKWLTIYVKSHYALSLRANIMYFLANGI